MLEHVDGETVGGTLIACLVFAGMWAYALRNPTDKVEARPEAPRGSAPGWIADLRRRARGWRELRASQRRAKVLARLELAKRRPE